MENAIHGQRQIKHQSHLLLIYALTLEENKVLLLIYKS